MSQELVAIRDGRETGRVVRDDRGKFHVSARNAFGLIACVGEDCAGAVQFVRPERIEATLGEAPPPIEWLDEAAIAQRLRALREDHSAWRIPRDTGQFSLAGAQPKTALLFDNNRWNGPSGFGGLGLRIPFSWS